MAKFAMEPAQALALSILALQEAKDEMRTDPHELAQAVKVLRSMKDRAKESTEQPARRR